MPLEDSLVSSCLGGNVRFEATFLSFGYKNLTQILEGLDEYAWQCPSRNLLRSWVFDIDRNECRSLEGEKLHHIFEMVFRS